MARSPAPHTAGNANARGSEGTWSFKSFSCTVKLKTVVNNRTYTNDNAYGAVIMARPLREFIRFI